MLHDFLHERRLANEVSSSLLGRYVTKLYGGYVDPLRYFTTYLKKTQIHVHYYKGFRIRRKIQNVLEEAASNPSIRTLHVALNEMLDRGSMNIDATRPSKTYG